MRPLAVVQPPSIESFGWGDFPLMTSEDLYISVEKPISSDSSSETLSTLCLEYEEDTLPEDDSELEDEEQTTFATSHPPTVVMQPQKQVCFDRVHVREHNVVLGVHPLAVGGYPLELGWEYNETLSCDVDAFERERGDNKLRRLSQIERHFKLAEMCGGDLVEVAEEEKLRKEILDGEQLQSYSSHAVDEDSNDDHLSDYTKQQMLRCASYNHLSNFF